MNVYILWNGYYFEYLHLLYYAAVLNMIRNLVMMKDQQQIQQDMVVSTIIKMFGCL